MAGDYCVLPPQTKPAETGLAKEYNRLVQLKILEETRNLEPVFSDDQATATFTIKGDDIPHEWRFERSGGRWRLSETR